jgi:FKBP-type peptidyl-prolyl cis-trans isomerase FklB
MVMTLGLGLCVGSANAQQEKAATPGGAAGTELKDLRQKASYGFGLNIGRTLKARSFDLDLDVLIRGIKDGAGDGKTLLTDEQIDETMQAFQKEMMAKEEAASKEQGGKNQKEGAAFLAENQKKPGSGRCPAACNTR